MKSKKAVLGLDLGGTKLAGAIFSTEGKILNRETVALDKRRGAQVGELINKRIQYFLDLAKAKDINIKAIGVSVPGIYYARTGKVWAPNIPEWEEYPLLDYILSVLPDKGIKVKVDSDRACYILGETWQGAAKGCTNAIFLAIGTGIGAGIMVDGKILRGVGDVAGAIGWVALDRPYRSEYATCGCFEYHASGEGIAKVARAYVSEDPNYSVTLRKGEITTRDVFAAHKKGDTLAEKVLNNAIEFWGMVVANLVSVFNPEKIIFGGGVFGPAVEFIDRIKLEAEKWAQPISIKQVSIEPTVLGGEAGLYGTGRLALIES